MERKEYDEICARIDALLGRMGRNLPDDHPDVVELLALSDRADSLYWEFHPELTAEVTLNLEVGLLVYLIRRARVYGLCLNELVGMILEENVKTETEKESE